MELSLLQAILLGLYYWFAVWYMGYSVLTVRVYRPAVHSYDLWFRAG